MNSINIQGIQLSQKAIDTLQDWQDDNNSFIDGACDNLDDVCFHLTNPDFGMSEKETLGLVAMLLDFRRQLKTLRKEDERDGREE